VETALILSRFLQFAVAMLLWGGCILRAGPQRAFGPRAVRLAALVNLLAALGWLAAEAALAGDGPQDAVNPDVLWALLTASRFGHAWLVHLALAAALVLASLCDWPRTVAACAGLNLASLALTGHAVLPVGPLGVVHQALSALHLLAAGFWVGGLVVILPGLTPATLTEKSAQILRRFSRWGHLAVALVFATGLAKSVLILAARGRFDPAWDYLTLLLIKVAAVVLMLGLALINRYRFVPRLATADRALALRHLRHGTLAELALVVAVLALVSVFATLSPFADV
jgi:putative copper resistance protein D